MSDTAPAPRPLRVLVALLLLGGAFGLALIRGLGSSMDDYDELWHLATGRFIVESGTVPGRDPFTFTAGGAPWANSNWLAQVVLYVAYRAGGLELDWLLGFALFAGASAFALERARRHARSAWAVVPVAWFVLSALRTGSTVRPQGWTFLLFAVALLLADVVRDRGSKLAAAGVALALVLAGQMHAGYVFPLFAVAVLAVANLWEPGPTGRRASLLLGMAALAGIATFAVHPHGLDALWHPVRYGADPRFREMARVTQELKPPDFTRGVGELTAPFVLLLLGGALVARERVWLGDAVLSVGFVHLALTSTRGVHYLAVVAAAPLARVCSGALARAREEAPALVRARLRAIDSLEPAAALAAKALPLALLAALLTTAAVRADRLAPGRPGDVSSPLLGTHSDVATIASLLDAKKPPGRMWNEIETGGFLIWRLWPSRRVFIDGRGDFHARAGTWADQEIVREARPGWEKVLAKWECDLALVTEGTRTEVAFRGAGWREAYRAVGTRDRTLVLFVRPGSPSDASLR